MYDTELLRAACGLRPCDELAHMVATIDGERLPSGLWRITCVLSNGTPLRPKLSPELPAARVREQVMRVLSPEFLEWWQGMEDAPA